MKWEHICRLIYTTMISIEDSDLFVSEECYIEYAVVMVTFVILGMDSCLRRNDRGKRNNGYKFKYSSYTGLIECKGFGMIDKLISEQSNNC